MMVQEFNCFSNIDVHNHYRQGSLAMEKSWRTHKWYHRIFTTVFGMCVVDAFYAHKYECHGNMQFTEFTSTLAHELVHNYFLDNQVDLRRRAEAVGAENEVCACFHCGWTTIQYTNRFYPIFPYLQDSASVCRILPLQEAKCYKGSEKQVQLRCRQCGEKQGGIARRVVPMEAIRDRTQCFEYI